jgi:hypothetical protein
VYSTEEHYAFPFLLKLRMGILALNAERVLSAIQPAMKRVACGQ